MSAAQASGLEQAARDFLYVLYANDTADFQRRIMPQKYFEMLRKAGAI